MSMGSACRECAAGKPHCHGTLISHSTRHLQCTEPGCLHPEVLLHSLTVDCDAVGCPCAEGLPDRAGDERAAM